MGKKDNNFIKHINEKILKHFILILLIISVLKSSH